MRTVQQQDKERFAAWLKSARERKGLSRREVARRVGVSGSTISRAESAQINLTIETVVQIADGLSASRLVALIESGVVVEIDTEDAEVAVLFATLTGDRRQIARRMLVMLAAMETEGRRQER